MKRFLKWLLIVFVIHLIIMGIFFLVVTAIPPAKPPEIQATTQSEDR